MEEFWYPLDNAAKIFPAITTDEVTSVFRISAVFKHKIHIRSLFLAVRSIERRFPYYHVILKKGFFWYYLESARFHTSVETDNQPPCRRFRKGDPLFRVLVLDNRVSVEFSHLLTDGGGAYEYFKTLIVVYLGLTGTQVPADFKYLRPDEDPLPEEFEDAYNRYFKENIPASVKKPRAFHVPFPLRGRPALSVLFGAIPHAELKAKAKEKGVNITVYLTSAYLFVLQEIYEDLRSRRHKRFGKLSLEIPINVRKIYPSTTMRNFSLFVMPEIDLRLGHYSFEEILKVVHHQMLLETEEKLVNKILSRNVGSEKMLLVRGAPLFLKNVVLRMKYYSMGSNQYSGVFSNLGGAIFPKEINEQIEYMAVIPPPPNKSIKISCGMIGFDDLLILGFANISGSRELERRFFRFISGQGVPVKMIGY